jgi:hypothetical protein
MPDWTLDHVVIASYDLESDINDFHKNLQTKPIPGGKHPSLGTRNALVSVVNSKTYIELLAPDPRNTSKLGHQMLSMHGRGLSLTPYHYAIRTSNLEAVRKKAKSLGMEPTEIEEASRTNTNGKILKWKWVFLRGHKLGGLVPFFVDWSGSTHPTDAMNVGDDVGAACLSVKVVVAAPTEYLNKVKSLLQGVEGVEFEENETPALYFPVGISGMEGGSITTRGFQPDGIDFEESKTRAFQWTRE